MTPPFDTLTLLLKVGPPEHSKFINWQTDLHHKIAEAAGFLSLEILSPACAVEDWAIVQRFSDKASAILWKDSDTYQTLMQRLQSLALNRKINELAETQFTEKSSVIEVFITHVSLDKISFYRHWIAKIHEKEVQFPGFRGVYVQSPLKDGAGNWITLLKFDTSEHLNQWLASSERAELLKESLPLVDSFESHQVISPYENWFPNLSQNEAAPAIWKQTMVILLIIFPIIMLQFKFLMPLTKNWDISLATFTGNAISVTLISWPLMPIMIKLLKWWLLPQGPSQQMVTFLGTSLLIILYALEIIFFWRFI